MLVDLTRDQDQRDARMHENCAHVIYVSVGKPINTRLTSGAVKRVFQASSVTDYAAENAPDSIRTYADASAWAQKTFKAHADAAAKRAVNAFRIEWW